MISLLTCEETTFEIWVRRKRMFFTTDDWKSMGGDCGGPSDSGSTGTVMVAAVRLVRSSLESWKCCWGRVCGQLLDHPWAVTWIFPPHDSKPKSNTLKCGVLGAKVVVRLNFWASSVLSSTSLIQFDKSKIFEVFL